MTTSSKTRSAPYLSHSSRHPAGKSKSTGRVPLSGPDGKPLSLEDLYRDERAFRLAGIMNAFTAPLRLPRSETELVI